MQEARGKRHNTRGIIQKKLYATGESQESGGKRKEAKVKRQKAIPVSLNKYLTLKE